MDADVDNRPASNGDFKAGPRHQDGGNLDVSVPKGPARVAVIELAIPRRSGHRERRLDPLRHDECVPDDVRLSGRDDSSEGFSGHVEQVMPPDKLPGTIHRQGAIKVGLWVDASVISDFAAFVEVVSFGVLNAELNPRLVDVDGSSRKVVANTLVAHYDRQSRHLSDIVVEWRLFDSPEMFGKGLLSLHGVRSVGALNADAHLAGPKEGLGSLEMIIIALEDGQDRVLCAYSIHALGPISRVKWSVATRLN